MKTWFNHINTLTTWRCLATVIALVINFYFLVFAANTKVISSSAAPYHPLAVNISFKTAASQKTFFQQPVETTQPEVMTNSIQPPIAPKINDTVAKKDKPKQPNQKSHQAKKKLDNEPKKQKTKPSENIMAVNSAQSIPTDGVHDAPMITEPKFARSPKHPHYPKIARKRGQEGEVIIEVWLDKTGQQTKRLVIKSSGFNILDQSALNAVEEWQFKPYIVNGIPMASRARLPINFSL